MRRAGSLSSTTAGSVMAGTPPLTLRFLFGVPTCCVIASCSRMTEAAPAKRCDDASGVPKVLQMCRAIGITNFGTLASESDNVFCTPFAGRRAVLVSIVLLFDGEAWPVERPAFALPDADAAPALIGGPVRFALGVLGAETAFLTAESKYVNSFLYMRGGTGGVGLPISSANRFLNLSHAMWQQTYTRAISSSGLSDAALLRDCAKRKVAK